MMWGISLTHLCPHCHVQWQCLPGRVLLQMRMLWCVWICCRLYKTHHEHTALVNSLIAFPFCCPSATLVPGLWGSRGQTRHCAYLDFPSFLMQSVTWSQHARESAERRTGQLRSDGHPMHCALCTLSLSGSVLFYLRRAVSSQRSACPHCG